MTAIDWFVVAAYASLVVEMLWFAVPSEASTLQLFTRPGDDDDAVGHARGRSIGAKILGYLLPTAIGVAAFCIPLAAATIPGAFERLLPIGALVHPVARGVGVVLVVAGRVITVTAMRQLRGRAGKDVEATGLFAWSRNPGLVGMYVLYAGLVLIVPSALFIAAFVPYVWNMDRRVRLEESHLARIGGEPYARYRREVPRYVGTRSR